MEQAKEIVVAAPDITLMEADYIGVLVQFYKALGWNGEDVLDPTKVRSTKAVFQNLYDEMQKHDPDNTAIGGFLVNKGPGVDDDLLANTVRLLPGWVAPAAIEGEAN